MGEVVLVACQGFLVREACVGVLCGWSWISSLWSAMKCPVMSYEMSMVFGVTLSCLYIKAQGCVSVLLENLRGKSCSGTCWPLGGGWFQCRYGGV